MLTRRSWVPMQPETPQKVYARGGKIKGLSTGAVYVCQMEGCTGRRLVVKWDDGKISRPCTKGMTVRPDGCWQII